jgi:hypothetical protein
MDRISPSPLTSRPVWEFSLLSSRGFIHHGKAAGAWDRLLFPPFRPSSRMPGASPPFHLFAFSWRIQESNKLKFSRTSAYFLITRAFHFYPTVASELTALTIQHAMCTPRICSLSLFLSICNVFFNISLYYHEITCHYTVTKVYFLRRVKSNRRVSFMLWYFYKKWQDIWKVG